jgi:hypothetical protein
LGEEAFLEDIGGKARRKENTGKTKMQVIKRNGRGTGWDSMD